MRYLSLLLAVFGLTFLACKDKSLSPEEQLQEDIAQLDQYLKDKGLAAQSTASGLRYIITKEGVGPNPTIQSNVTVRYKGYFLDDTVFDQTEGTKTIAFPLSNVIAGWQECVPLLKAEGKGTFFIPSALAYGPDGNGGIPPNTPLIFDIELVSF
jgi:FKBP-type peptidyl-prolyl cis-trans isomerase FkpA